MNHFLLHLDCKFKPLKDPQKLDFLVQLLGVSADADLTGAFLSYGLRLQGLNFLVQVHHFQGADGGIVALIAGLAAGTFNGLGNGICGQDAEHDRAGSFQ